MSSPQPSHLAPSPLTSPTPAALAAITLAQGLAHDARRATKAAAEALFRKQRDLPFAGRGKPGTHWCAELEGDSILSSEYILMKFILGQESSPKEWARLRRIANQLRLSQRPDGSWGQFPGSPIDISATVKAYLALKLLGDNPDAPHMQLARAAALKHGGAEKCNTFSTFYLACLGIVDWNACPAIPPQIVLLPRWFPFHLDKVAAWTRTMILPLALCSATQPVRKLPAGMDIDELFIDKRYKYTLSKPWKKAQPVCWHNFFLLADRFLKLCRRVGFTPLRQHAIRKAEAWIKARMTAETTEGLGAIFPPMVYVQVAFQRLGYTRDHPIIRQAEADLDAFMIDEPNADPNLDHIRLQPCFSPVWDTAIALDALTEAGFTAGNDERVAKACDWLIANEVKLVGDWHRNLRPGDKHLQPGIDCACWAFEYRNDWYPDVDDTCMVAKALHKAGDRVGGLGGVGVNTNKDAAARAVRWVIAMQNDDGGWAAFDRTKDRPWMEAIPFADHNAMQDPSCSDITGRVMESLITCGVQPSHPAIHQGTNYLLRTQKKEGCWWGRWGVNYIYGTWQAVNGLMFAHSPLAPNAGCRMPNADAILLPTPLPNAESRMPNAVRASLTRARDWLLSVQNPDGGFGESANSYLDASLMAKGASTASQTAWGLITLLHLLPADHPAVTRAAAWLVADQLKQDKKPFQPAHTRAGHTTAHDASWGPNTDHVHDFEGGWNEHHFSGTGFPKVFYLRYHLYRHSFPLKALARFAARAGA
jgi:squalene-hopene/tetraprenyl-beta-curcumene cyclase